MPKVLTTTPMLGGYGGGDILQGCEISVDSAELVVIVGPNGAGKSTAMKAVFGMLSLREGSILFGNDDVTKLTPQDRVRMGMAFVPQTNNVFQTLTVRENLDVGAYLRDDDVSETLESVYQLFPAVYEKRNVRAGDLSGGQRQQVAVARALMTRPRLLLLDEPTAGVSPIVMSELFERLLAIRDNGVSILMVEQNAKQALNIANRAYVLVQGRNAFEGTGKALLSDPEVRKSFLGG